jgi:hypothetical protein
VLTPEEAETVNPELTQDNVPWVVPLLVWLKVLMPRVMGVEELVTTLL